MPAETIAAEQLASEFKEHSVADFFRKNKQMLGLVGKIRTLTTIIHEYVTNASDACEDARILPDIEIQIEELGNEHYEITVKDNGPGLTKETVGKAFGQLLAGTKFHRLVQMRGQQGMGGSGCTMFSQITTGKPTKIITGTGKGRAISLEVMIDSQTNTPMVSNLVELKREFRGTAVKARFKDVKYIAGEQGPLEYLRRTAIANPHVKIKFHAPGGTAVVFDRSSKEIPKRPVEVRPHPKGVTVDEMIDLAKASDARKVSSFLKGSLDRMGDKSVGEVEKQVSFDMNKDPKKIEWTEAEEIVKAFRKMDFIAPRTDGLRPIGEARIRKSLESIVKPEFLHVSTRKPAVYSGGFPFEVEVGVAYGGGAGRAVSGNSGRGGEVEGVEELRRIEVMRFANLAPLLFDAGGCAITKAVNSIDWRRYGVRNIEQVPLTVFVNLVSVHIPYTSAGKQAIADEPEILEEIRLALMESGRHTARYISGKRREEEKRMKRETFYKYIPEVAGALGRITREKEEGLKKKLEKLVLEKLKIEEKEAKAQGIEESVEKTVKGRSKVIGKKTKVKKVIGEEEGVARGEEKEGGEEMEASAGGGKEGEEGGEELPLSDEAEEEPVEEGGGERALGEE